MSFFWLLPQGPPATSCPSSRVDLRSGAAPGTVLRPCSALPGLATQTLGEEVGCLHRELQDADIRPRAEGAVVPRRFAHEHLAELISFSPVTKKTLPFFFVSGLVWGSCLLPGRVQREELLQMDTGTRRWLFHMALVVLIKKVEEWCFFFLSTRP